MLSIRSFTGRAAMCCLSVLVALPLCWAQVSLINTTRERQVPGGFETNRTFPKVSYGRLVSFVRLLQPDAPREVFLTSLENGSSQKFKLQIAERPGTLTDVGATISGNVVFGLATGTLESTVGSIGGADDSGNATFLTDTGGYTPYRVCAAPDETLWSLGQVTATERSLSGIQHDAGGLLRRYSRSGVLISSYVSRNSLPAGLLNLAPSGLTFGRDVTSAFLSCGESSVGVYLGRPFNVWIEVDYATGQAQKWTAAAMANARLTGLVLLDAKKVYGSYVLTDRSNGLFRLVTTSSGKANWVRYSQPKDDVSNLLGRDGPSLIHLNGKMSGNQKPVVHWSTPR